jgi:lipopolysaccharide transport system permease protein
MRMSQEPFQTARGAKKVPVIYSPPLTWGFPDLREVWEYRELIFFLVWRDLKTRYKQTALGISWAVIPILANTIIYSILLGALARLPSEGVPYLLFSFIGLTAWAFFSKPLTAVSTSLLSSAPLTGKIYFPRLVAAIAPAFSSLFDALISFVLLVGLMMWYQIVPHLQILLLPFFILFGIITAIATGIWLTALSIQYRDVAQGVGLMVNIWMYASPVIYSPTLIPSGLLSSLYWLNPIAISIQGFRWAIIGSALPPTPQVIISIVLVILILVSGLIYFKRVEQTFIDLL